MIITTEHALTFTGEDRERLERLLALVAAIDPPKGCACGAGFCHDDHYLDATAAASAANRILLDGNL